MIFIPGGFPLFRFLPTSLHIALMIYIVYFLSRYFYYFISNTVRLLQAALSHVVDDGIVTVQRGQFLILTTTSDAFNKNMSTSLSERLVIPIYCLINSCSCIFPLRKFTQSIYSSQVCMVFLHWVVDNMQFDHLECWDHTPIVNLILNKVFYSNLVPFGIFLIVRFNQAESLNPSEIHLFCM